MFFAWETSDRNAFYFQRPPHWQRILIAGNVNRAHCAKLENARYGVPSPTLIYVFQRQRTQPGARQSHYTAGRKAALTVDENKNGAQRLGRRSLFTLSFPPSSFIGSRTENTPVIPPLQLFHPLQLVERRGGGCGNCRRGGKWTKWNKEQQSCLHVSPGLTRMEMRG